MAKSTPQLQVFNAELNYLRRGSVGFGLAIYCLGDCQLIDGGSKHVF